MFACVGNDDDLRSVVLGEHGAFAGMKPGAVFVDHTTASAKVARELHDAAKSRGLHFVDAPVSGGQAGAVNGLLTVMCGGDQAAFDRIRPVAMAFSRACTLVGGPGAGQLAKMVNQVCIAGLVQGLSEGIAFGLAAGLDMKLVLEVIGKGAAQSWQMDNRGTTMVDDQFDFGFADAWMRKDSACASTKLRNGAPLPVTALVDQFYGDVQRMGGAVGTPQPDPAPAAATNRAARYAPPQASPPPTSTEILHGLPDHRLGLQCDDHAGQRRRGASRPARARALHRLALRERTGRPEVHSSKDRGEPFRSRWAPVT